MKFQQQIESYFYNISKTQKKDVILVNDRGVLDPIAYSSDENRDLIFGSGDPELSHENLVTTYDMVLHMVTAANGAEEFYTLENNDARTETAEMAVEIDYKLQAAYHGAHNHL